MCVGVGGGAVVGGVGRACEAGNALHLPPPVALDGPPRCPSNLTWCACPAWSLFALAVPQTLRFMPSVPLITRRLEEPVQVAGSALPAGCEVSHREWEWRLSILAAFAPIPIPCPTVPLRTRAHVHVCA